MVATMSGFLTWADRLYNPWLSEAATVGGVSASLAATAEPGEAWEAAAWSDQASAFANFFERRQRVFAGPWCRVLEDKGRESEREAFWALVRGTPGLDWMVLMNDAKSAAAALPADWGGGYKNVWIGSKGTGSESVGHALGEMRKVPARMRFLVASPVLGDVGDLDLSGIGWIVVNSAPGGGAEAADWVASVKLQAMCFGVPVWFENERRVDMSNDLALPLVMREQPRSRA